MLGVRTTVWLFALIGCGDNIMPPTATRTQVIPSVQGDRVAYVLEPLLAAEDPTTIGAQKTYRYTERAPTMLVDLDTDKPIDTPIDTFVVGMTQVVIGSTRAWVLQSTFAEWQGQNAMSEPAARTTNVAVVDRNTLKVTSHAVLDPPIDTPIAIGDELFDVSHDPTNSGRLAVRVRDDSGGAEMIADEAGSNPAWCSSPDHLVYALEHAPSALRILDIRRTNDKWITTRHDLDNTEIGEGGIACDETGARIAVDTKDATTHTRNLLVLDLPTGLPAFPVDGLSAPFVLASDGGAVIAQRTSDHRLVRATKAGMTELDFVTDTFTTARPLVVGNLALFNTRTVFQIIDLRNGNLGATIDTSQQLARVIPWPAPAGAAWSGGFAVMHYNGHELTALGTASTEMMTMPMSLPPLVRDPQLLTTAGTRMYLAASNDTGDVRQVYGFDRASPQPVSTATAPDCDPLAIAHGSCR